MKQDNLFMTLLFDYYGELLSDKQKLCFDLYYNQDLSLSEIAEQAGITRQGVHDTIARAESLLCNFEEKIGCIARDRRNREALAVIDQAATALQVLPGARPLADTILSASARIKE